VGPYSVVLRIMVGQIRDVSLRDRLDCVRPFVGVRAGAFG
jgi:hypothetical protein